MAPQAGVHAAPILSVLMTLSLAAAAVALLAVTARPAGAWSLDLSTFRRGWVEKATKVGQGPLEVEVRVEGRTAPLYRTANRFDRWYLEAFEGGNYEVRVRNRTGERVAFLIAVDGVNAINGRLTNLSPDEPLYVLDPYERTTVKGWRKDMRNVSRFVFVDEERSYAERTGQANGDLGWIRVLAFEEQKQVAWGPGVRFRDGGARPLDKDAAPLSPESRSGSGSGSSSDQAAPAPAPGSVREQAKGTAPQSSRGDAGNYGVAPQAAPESNPGTGWGRNERDRAHWVDFEPQRTACAQVILRYEYRGALVALGILPYRPGDRTRLEQRENGTYGFAQPPDR